MSKISDIYEQIKLQQYLLAKTKLEEAVKASKERRVLSEEEQVDYLFSDDEVSILINLLKEKGFVAEQQWVNYSDGGYDMPTRNFFVSKIDGELVTMFTDDWGTKEVPSISNNEEVKQFLLLHFVDEDEIDEQMQIIQKLININLEELEINQNKEEQKLKEDTGIDFKNLAYDLDSHEVIDIREIDVDLDYVHIADLETVIYSILRNTLIDTKSNAKFNEAGNYCMIGEYSDMPGEEEIAKILNSVDKEILAEYLKRHPADITRFEDMRSKYENIQEMDVEIIPPKDLFEESLLREDVVEYYLSKTPEELEAEFGKKVARMVGYKQENSHHCYDLWEHTLRTVEGIKPDGLTEEQFKKLRVAAFFHDIGKPDVSKINEKTGQQVFYGHAARSVDVAWSILDGLGYSEEEIEQLSFYIGHHDDFISYKSKELPYMKNHTHLRAISSDTVLEKLIENQYDFEAMEYSKDEIRFICSALAHNGTKPIFKDKDGKFIDVDMEEVQEKIDSGDYDPSYIPAEEDYKLLLRLCRADAGAQSEIARRVTKEGKTVIDGTKAEKIDVMNNVEANIPQAFKELKENFTEYTFKQFIADSVPKALGEKRPMIICKDGTEYSIQASSFHACSPRKDGLEYYEEFEMGNIADWKTGALEEYLNHDGIAGNVPIAVIEEIIKAHGGLNKKIMKERIEQQKAVYKPKGEKYESMIREASGGNEFLANLLRYATRKCDLTDKNEQAKGLLNDYEQQASKDVQTHSDED